MRVSGSPMPAASLAIRLYEYVGFNMIIIMITHYYYPSSSYYYQHYYYYYHYC